MELDEKYVVLLCIQPINSAVARSGTPSSEPCPTRIAKPPSTTSSVPSLSSDYVQCPLNVATHFSGLGSSSIPSFSSLLLASSSAHVCILWQRPVSRYPVCSDNASGEHCVWLRCDGLRSPEKDLRSIRLERVCDGGNYETAIEAPVERSLPALFLVLLSRAQSPEPTAGRVVVVAVVAA